MNTTNPQQVSGHQKESVNIDPKRIFYQATRYWYLIVLSVLVCVTTAFLVNRYATKVYSIKASIIVKESEEVSGGELLYNNPLVKFYRNYLNEIYILKSIPLMERTVKDLNFEESFFRVGNFLTTESYKSLPFEVDIIKNTSDSDLNFKFKVLNNNDFTINYTIDQKDFEESRKFHEEISIGNVVFKLYHNDSIGDFTGDSFAYAYKPPISVGKSYASRLSADWAEEGAGVINLSLNGPNPQKEIDFLAGLIKNYQDYDLDNKNKVAANTIEFITDQLKNISDSLNKAERQLEVFKNKNIVTDLNSEALRLYQKMEGLEIQKTDLIIRDSYYNYLSDYITKSDDNLDQVILPTSVGITDPILTGLVTEVINSQTKIKMLERGEKLQNPLVIEGRKRIHDLKTDILESVKNQKSVDKIKLDFLNKGIREIEGQLQYLPIAERQLVNIKRNYALLENLYVFLLQRKAEAGISRASNTTDIVIVNPPMSSGAISPLPMRNYVFAFATGLFIPLLIFVLLEFSNTRIQSREDIENITSIPFIGGVGHKRMDQNLEVFAKPKSAISESFRALRSNLNFFLEGRDKGIFLITSSISGEGKTFTSINLASVFALSGKKTLIIGADMRKPKIFTDFKLDNSVGLSSYLAGLAEFEQVVRPTEYENLYLVSGGPVPPNPSELILGKRMELFLEQSKAQFDFIFIDSPPLALVTDAFVLSALADHTLFIVRQNYTPKSLLKTIDDFHSANKIRKISFVLNDIYKSGPGYGYGYGYAYGYGYGYGYKQRKNGAGYYEE